MSHTPAPWTIAMGQICGDGSRIGTVDNSDENAGLTASEAEANALLIAAAPELLMRLDDLVHGLEGMQLPGSLPNRLKKARAALAKATGEKA